MRASGTRAAVGRVMEGKEYLATQLERAIDECGDEDKAILSLLEKGAMLEDALSNSRVSEEEVWAALRANGMTN